MPLLTKPPLALAIFQALGTLGPTRVSLPAPPSTTSCFLATGLPLAALIVKASVPAPSLTSILEYVDVPKVPTTVLPERTWACVASRRRRLTASEPPVPSTFRTLPDTDAVTAGTARSSSRSSSGRAARERTSGRRGRG